MDDGSVRRDRPQHVADQIVAMKAQQEVRIEVVEVHELFVFAGDTTQVRSIGATVHVHGVAAVIEPHRSTNEAV